MNRKVIPDGTKIPILFSEQEWRDISKETYLDADMTRCAVLEQSSYKVTWTIGDIDYAHGDIAATANHTADKKLKKRLDAILRRLENLLDSYQEESEDFS